MATASITFNDGSGSQTITPTPSVSRFNRWHPVPDTIGERAHAVGDGVGYQWVHRTDYAVRCELNHLAHSDEAKLQDFLLWANAFGAFQIATGVNTYATCQIAPGTRAELSDPDPETMEFTLSLTALNVAVSPAQMLSGYT